MQEKIISVIRFTNFEKTEKKFKNLQPVVAERKSYLEVFEMKHENVIEHPEKSLLIVFFQVPFLFLYGRFSTAFKAHNLFCTQRI